MLHRYQSLGYVEPPQSETLLGLRKRYRTALENSLERVEYKIQYEQWTLEVKKTKDQWEWVFPMMMLAMTDSLRRKVERGGKFAESILIGISLHQLPSDITANHH